MGGIGVLLAFLIMVLYFQRLALYHLPAKDVRTAYTCDVNVIFTSKLQAIISTFLPLGPCGQGGYALIELVSSSTLGDHLFSKCSLQGRGAMSLFPKLAAADPENEAYAALAAVGPSMYGSALVAGLMLWGLGIWWMFHAIVTVSTHYMTFDIAFNVSFIILILTTLVIIYIYFKMGAWGVTFPLGSLALLTFSLAKSFDSMFFKYGIHFLPSVSHR